MHAAASSEDSHYQNYIGDLGAKPSAGEYVAPVYIDSNATEMDEDADVGGGSSGGGDLCSN